MKKFVAELIGTFMLVFIGTGAVVFGNGLDGLGHLGIAFAFGLAIVVAAYSIGTVSGAHLNPAVSIAMFINKRLSSRPFPKTTAPVPTNTSMNVPINSATNFFIFFLLFQN